MNRINACLVKKSSLLCKTNNLMIQLTNLLIPVLQIPNYTNNVTAQGKLFALKIKVHLWNTPFPAQD